jgi:hypothetical protein
LALNWTLELVMRPHVFLSAILAEFRRAHSAARWYENQRYGRAGSDGFAPSGVPRRIFEDFYAHRDDIDLAPPDVSGLDPIDIDVRLRAWRAARLKTLLSLILAAMLAALREALRRHPGRRPLHRFSAEVPRDPPVRLQRTCRGSGENSHVQADT